MGELGALSDSAKHLLTDLLGLGRDGSHVQIGMMLFVGALLLLRGRGIAWVWGGLLALELVNEWIDWGFPMTTLAGSAKDVVTTMLGPTLLWLAMVWTSRRAGRHRSGEDGEQALEQG